MKKSVKIIAALCLMAALVLSLAACGIKEKDLVGLWECDMHDIIKNEMISRGFSDAEAEDTAAHYYGMKQQMYFYADKVCYVWTVDDDDIRGNVFTWSLKGDTLTLTETGWDDETVELKVDDDTLLADDPDMDLKYIFKKK